MKEVADSHHFAVLAMGQERAEQNCLVLHAMETRRRILEPAEAARVMVAQIVHSVL